MAYQQKYPTGLRPTQSQANEEAMLDSQWERMMRNARAQESGMNPMATMRNGINMPEQQGAYQAPNGYGTAFQTNFMPQGQQLDDSMTSRLFRERNNMTRFGNRVYEVGGQNWRNAAMMELANQRLAGGQQQQPVRTLRLPAPIRSQAPELDADILQRRQDAAVARRQRTELLKLRRRATRGDASAKRELRAIEEGYRNVAEMNRMREMEADDRSLRDRQMANDQAFRMAEATANAERQGLFANAAAQNPELLRDPQFMDLFRGSSGQVGMAESGGGLPSLEQALSRMPSTREGREAASQSLANFVDSIEGADLSDQELADYAKQQGYTPAMIREMLDENTVPLRYPVSKLIANTVPSLMNSDVSNMNKRYSSLQRLLKAMGD